ncbi:zinc-ribbon domain-containing protein [Acidobacteriia bacterium AH_259_A11_L15]|nr:zinc-ribbon domain-containing protein [Acidobacteriia bacterium AH_259_A11_L15]
MLVVIACGALALAALLYVFWLTPEPVRVKSAAERERDYLEEKRQVLYENLRDLHLEYRMGKLSDQDYQRIKTTYQADMTALLHHELSGTGVSPVALPADPSAGALPEPGAAAKAGLPAEARRAKAGRCLRCGKDNPPENRFCGACGAELSREDQIQ